MRPLRGVLRAAAALWLLAALIHLRVTPEHPEEWWGYVPLFGPGAGEVEGVGFVDSCATATEVGIAGALGATPLRGTSAESRRAILLFLGVGLVSVGHVVHLVVRAS